MMTTRYFLECKFTNKFAIWIKQGFYCQKSSLKGFTQNATYILVKERFLELN